ncbi:transposable element Tcb1 transposase [Trichonephila clavipes]|nr:transposable element Tcb1 transposase [Trichonephila clavipes]
MHLSATPRWSDSSLKTPWREDAEQLRYAPPHWSCTRYYGMGRYWISLSHSSSTHCRYFKQPALHHISEVLEPVVLPYLHGLATALFQQDNARPHVTRIVQRFFVNHQIELLPWPACSLDFSPIENIWSMVAQRLTQITPPAATPDQLWQRVEAAWSAVPQEHIQSLFESMPRHVAVVISNNGGYSGNRFWQEPHFTEVHKFNHLIIGQHVIYKINFVVLSLVFLGVTFTVASRV